MPPAVRCDGGTRVRPVSARRVACLEAASPCLWHSRGCRASLPHGATPSPRVHSQLSPPLDVSPRRVACLEARRKRRVACGAGGGTMVGERTRWRAWSQAPRRPRPCPRRPAHPTHPHVSASRRPVPRATSVRRGHTCSFARRPRTRPGRRICRGARASKGRRRTPAFLPRQQNWRSQPFWPLGCGPLRRGHRRVRASLAHEWAALSLRASLPARAGSRSTATGARS